MLFRNLLAPFARALAPRGWVVPLILAGLSGAQFFTQQRQNRQYRGEVDAAREARGNLFAAVGPRLAGLEGVDPAVLSAAGRGLPPAPPQNTNLFQQAMEIAGAYAENRKAEAEPQAGEQAPIEATPSVSPSTAVHPPPQAMMGAAGAAPDPAAQAAQGAEAAGAGGPEAQMGAMTQPQQPGAEDQAADLQAANRDMFDPLSVFAMS